MLDLFWTHTTQLLFKAVDSAQECYKMYLNTGLCLDAFEPNYFKLDMVLDMAK